MNQRRFFLFLLGMFAMTEVNLVGYIGVSELFCYAMGPVFFCMDYRRMKQDGFTPFLMMAVFMFASGLLSNWVNHAPVNWALRGLAASFSIFAITSTLYHFLKDNIMDCRWLLAGFAVSTTLCVFVLQPGNIRGGIGGIGGDEATQRAMDYSLFWFDQLATWLPLPIYLCYRRMPKAWILMVSAFLLVFGFVFSNNRSSLIVGSLTFLLLMVSDQHHRSMRFIKTNFWALVVTGLILAPLGNWFYKWSARQGFLGEAAQRKYEVQISRVKGGVWGTLIAGRAGTFAGLYAAIDKPILGHGAWAPDTKGYWGYFITKYGDEKDYKVYSEKRQQGKIATIPAHSFIVCFWIWNGIGGLAMALYMLYLLVSTLKNRLDTIPHLYGYFAFMIPPYLWSIFFSPFGRRMITVTLFVLCLFVRAAAKRGFDPRRVGLVKGDPRPSIPPLALPQGVSPYTHY